MYKYSRSRMATIALSSRTLISFQGLKYGTYQLIVLLIAIGVAFAYDESPPMSGAHVRLLDGTDSHEGVLRYFHPVENRWVYVCGEGVQKVDADVVCKELGFHGADVIMNVTRFIDNTTYNALRNIWCDTPDGLPHDTIDECGLSGVADAGVCDEKAAHIKCLTTRLTGGHDRSSGRLEVWSPGSGWGKVCSPNFGEMERQVTCRELGYKYVSMLNVESANQFEDSNLRYHWADVSCTGSETKLAECNLDMTNSTSCPGYGGAFSACANVETDPGTPPFMGVQLVDGPCATEGRLEVFDGEEYGTVCQEQITDLDARVVCRQLGYDYENAEVVRCCDTFAAARVGASDLFGVLNCTGDETMISQCSHPEVGSRVGCTTIRHTNDVGIRCQACKIKTVNMAAVIGGAIGFIFILIVIAVVLWYVCYIPKRKYKPAADENDDDDYVDPKPKVEESEDVVDHRTENGVEKNAYIDLELNDEDLKEKITDTAEEGNKTDAADSFV